MAKKKHLFADDPENFTPEPEQTAVIVKNELFLPIPNEGARIAVAQRLIDKLAGEHSYVETQVLLKYAEAVVKCALEINKDASITSLSGNEDTVLGAKVKTRSDVEYEYDDATLQAIDAKIADLKKQADERRKLLRSLTSEMADTETGEIIHPAKKIKDGCTIVVSLPK